jgi:hypothetical protein
VDSPEAIRVKAKSKRNDQNIRKLIFYVMLLFLIIAFGNVFFLLWRKHFGNGERNIVMYVKRCIMYIVKNTQGSLYTM